MPSTCASSEWVEMAGARPHRPDSATAVETENPYAAYNPRSRPKVTFGCFGSLAAAGSAIESFQPRAPPR